MNHPASPNYAHYTLPTHVSIPPISCIRLTFQEQREYLDEGLLETLQEGRCDGGCPKQVISLRVQTPHIENEQREVFSFLFLAAAYEFLDQQLAQILQQHFVRRQQHLHEAGARKRALGSVNELDDLSQIVDGNVLKQDVVFMALFHATREETVEEVRLAGEDALVARDASAVLRFQNHVNVFIIVP